MKTSRFLIFFQYYRVNVTSLAVPKQVVGCFFPTEIVSNHLSRTLCRHVNKYDRETKEQNDLCSNVSTNLHKLLHKKNYLMWNLLWSSFLWRKWHNLHVMGAWFVWRLVWHAQQLFVIFRKREIARLNSRPKVIDSRTSGDTLETNYSSIIQVWIQFW